MSSTSGSSLKIGHRFALASSVVVVLAMSVFWLVTNFNTESILRQQADSLGESLARQTAILVTELVLSNDLISMNVLLNQLTRDAAISQAAVLSVDDQVIAIAGNTTVNERDQIFGNYLAPIALQGSLAGYVRINLDHSYIERGVTTNFTFMLGAMALLIVVAVTVSMAVAQHFISFPLRSLSTLLQQMQEGDIELSPFADRRDEVGDVMLEYNRLAHALERGPQGKPVLPTGFDQLLATDDESLDAPSTAAVMGSVLHIRIVNYEHVFNASNARHCVTRLNQCYYLLGQVAELYNGNIEHCHQDDMLISFGARQIDPEHAFHASCSALLFLSLMQKVDSDQVNQGFLAFRFQSGMHSGDLLTGVLSPIAPNRYTVAGDTLAIARRISAEGAENSLIVSEQAMQHAAASEHLNFEAFSEFFDKQTDQLITTYRVGEPSTGLAALLDSQTTHLLPPMS